MGKKGLSRDEKLQRCQELLHETKTAMTLKELETRCYKEKGIVSNTVKDIAGELCADGLVVCEKIGLSNYYWSFPSQALVARINRKANWDESIGTKKRRREELAEDETKLAAARDPLDGERDIKLARYAELCQDEAKVDAELKLLSNNDPELIEAVKLDTNVAKTAIERWTDNLYTVKKFFQEKTNCTEDQFDGNFETAAMVYLDDE